MAIEDIYNAAGYTVAAGLVKTYWQGNRDLVHEKNLLINNTVQDVGTYGAWNGGPRSLGYHTKPYEVRNNFIGNHFINAGVSVSRGQQDSRHHHNTWTNPPTVLWSFYDGHIDLHLSNNVPNGTWGLAGTYNLVSNLPTPTSTPSNLTVTVLPSANRLSWAYPQGTDHDSFELQYSQDGSAGWETIAFRAPHDGRFDFSSNNAELVPYDPLRYTHRNSVTSGVYRIRALNGDASSAWSNLATLP